MKEYLPDDFVNFLTSVVIAMMGGMMSYALKTYEGKAFKWGEFLLHGAISGFAGFIAYKLLIYCGTSPDIVGVLCGITGWMGTRAMKIFEYILGRKLGLNKLEADANDDETSE